MGAIIGGAAQVAGSLIGSSARKREHKAAKAQQQNDLSAVRNFQFTNPYANQENTAEDLTVNQQASNFQAQQSDAGLAQALDASVQGGGGGGSAIAFANAALGAKQGLSADLAGQEQTNQRLRAQQAAQNQQLEAQGEEDLQSQRYTQADDNLNVSNQRFQAAEEQKQQATNQLVGGIGSIAGGIAGGGLSGIGSKIGGLFGGK